MLRLHYQARSRIEMEEERAIDDGLFVLPQSPCGLLYNIGWHAMLMTLILLSNYAKRPSLERYLVCDVKPSEAL